VTDLKQLRDSLQRKIEDSRSAVEKAKVELQIAQSNLSSVEEKFAAISADVKRRLAAIQLVEEMAETEPRTERHPYLELSQEEAMRLALAKAGHSMNSTELAEMLRVGGYPFRSANPANSIVVASNTNRNGYFVTTKEGKRTIIALKEWGAQMAPNPFDDIFNDNIDPSDIGAGALR
jgi:hypothetical protein